MPDTDYPDAQSVLLTLIEEDRALLEALIALLVKTGTIREDALDSALQALYDRALPTAETLFASLSEQEAESLAAFFLTRRLRLL